MANESPDSSPPRSKRLKTLALSPKCESRKQQPEQELLSIYDNSIGVCCGICLVSSDDGKSIRGQIDSCDHYFCFVCIMEWAKVESRCPVCKRRFATIRRPPKHGVFSQERLVHVPKRDQVYHLLGNATVGPSDPYSQVQCTVCHSMADECLLLLCDLCDSASHTYCVGLGATVPEGDWFCNDCTLSRAMHDKAEMNANGDVEGIVGSSDAVSKFESNISVFDIVSERIYPVVERPQGRAPSRSNESAVPVVSRMGNNVADEVTEPISRTRQNKAGNITESGARTLHCCQNVRNRIRAIRENWDAFRNGSLRFPSRSLESGASSERSNPGKLRCERPLGQFQSSPSNNQQLSGEGSCPHDGVQNRDFHDIDKAWKMMDIAKSMRQKGESASSSHQASEYKGSALREAPKTSQNLNITKHQIGARNVRSAGVEKQDEYNSLERKTPMDKFSKFEKQKQSWASGQEFSKELATINAHRYFESSSAHKVQNEGNKYTINEATQSPRNTYGSPSSSTNEHGESSYLKTLVGSVPGPSNSSSAKLEPHTFTSSKVDANKRKVRLGKNSANSKSGKGDDAKIEIQSLVKLNLKLLSREKNLRVEAFKEIARISTHTILAACGLEHRKSDARSFPSCVCNHVEQSHKLHKSTLTSNSCRECFYVFVKDVVNSLLERTDKGKI